MENDLFSMIRRILDQMSTNVENSFTKKHTTKRRYVFKTQKPMSDEHALT